MRDIPFVARHASRTREEVCKTLKIPGDKPIVLASFGGYGLTALDTDVLSKFKKYTVTTVTASPTRGRRDAPATEKKGSVISINEESMYAAGVRYEDLVGVAEAVVTKPGYGIVSECIANDAADLSTPHAATSPSTTSSSRRCRSSCVRRSSTTTTCSRAWESHLDKLLAQAKPKKKPETNGAESPRTFC